MPYYRVIVERTRVEQVTVDCVRAANPDEAKLHVWEVMSEDSRVQHVREDEEVVHVELEEMSDWLEQAQAEKGVA